MIVDPIFIAPEGSPPEDAEYVVFAITFEREDWESFGLSDNTLELNELYLGKDEFNNFRAKLNDPLYLNVFYRANEKLLKAQYWRRVSRDRFVEDTRVSVPVIFEDFKKAFMNRNLYDLFEPLDKRDVAIRLRNENRKSPHQILRLKSKYGFIADRVPFRIYAIEVDTDCFIITGGAIKIVEEMKQAPNTNLELQKLNYVLSALNEAGISNKESLLSILYERSSQTDV